jgi:hypothetical protein
MTPKQHHTVPLLLQEAVGAALNGNSKTSGTSAGIYNIGIVYGLIWYNIKIPILKVELYFYIIYTHPIIRIL